MTTASKQRKRQDLCKLNLVETIIILIKLPKCVDALSNLCPCYGKGRFLTTWPKCVTGTYVIAYIIWAKVIKLVELLKKFAQFFTISVYVCIPCPTG